MSIISFFKNLNICNTINELCNMSPKPLEINKDVHLALIFKDFAAWLKTSCVGLNVAGYTSASVLKDLGVDVSVFPVRHNVDIVHAIDKYNETHEHRLTHVVISAPWLSVYDLKALLTNFSDIKFVILSHSNVGFLQADPWGVALFREYIEMTKTYKNLQVGGNSKKFVKWLDKAYDNKSVLLPNLYPLSNDVEMKPVWDGESKIKIGILGAPRPQKNFMTAAAAALLIHKECGVPVEIHMNADVEDHRNVVSVAIEQMLKDIPNVTLIKHKWMYWNDFIEIISDMDLLLQPSYTESFNMITADGISVGVPSVVSSAIYWAPEEWKAETDDASEIAKTGITLLTDQYIKDMGVTALKHHNRKSLYYWGKFLNSKD